jgi:class 3 adenylate cyclase
VVVGQQTLALVEGQFECRPLGSFSLKGKEKEVLVYEVVRAVPDEASSSPSPAGKA